jgi:hypothetical protein
VEPGQPRTVPTLRFLIKHGGSPAENQTGESLGLHRARRAKERSAMKVVLIIALAVLCLCLLPLLRGLFLMLFRRAAAKGAPEDVGKQALANLPDRITLAHQNLHSWKADPAVQRFADPLFSKGFQEGGLFAIREMTGVLVRFLVKPSECIVAAIGFHPQAGAWLDLVTYYQNGNSATFTTNPSRGLAQRPGHPTLHATGYNAVGLYTKIVAERPKGVFRPVMPEDLCGLYERAWAESASWRKNKGLSAAEVALVAATRPEQRTRAAS